MRIWECGLRIWYSIPNRKSKVQNRYGDVAQLAERLICIQEVAGSTPVISTIFVL